VGHRRGGHGDDPTLEAGAHLVRIKGKEAKCEFTVPALPAGKPVVVKVSE